MPAIIRLISLNSLRDLKSGLETKSANLSSILRKGSWLIILVCIFIRPFISDITFIHLNFLIVNIFIIASFLYLHTKTISYTPLNVTVLAFLAAVIISALFSPSQINNISELYNYVFLVIMFYVVRTADSKERRSLLFAVIISATLVSVYSLRTMFVVSDFTLKYLSSHHISYPFAKEFLERRRTFSPFMSPNLLAEYLVMIIMLCGGIIMQNIKDKNAGYMTIVTGLCIVLSFITLFFTKSLGGWLVATMCVFLFFILIHKLNKKSAALLLVIALIPAAVFSIRTNNKNYFTKPSFSVHKRLNYWKETIHIITLHPIKGVGLGNFSLKESRTAHNSYLQIWAEMGILTFAIWLTIIFLFIKTGIKSMSSNGNIYYKAALFTCGIAFLIHNMIDFGFFTAQVSFLWWITLAFSAEISLKPQAGV